MCTKTGASIRSARLVRTRFHTGTASPFEGACFGWALARTDAVGVIEGAGAT